MVRNRITLFVSLAASVSCMAFAAPVPAEEPVSPADFYPPHTYMYLQVNPVSTFMGLSNLKLSKLLEDPTLGELFDQAMAHIPTHLNPEAIYERYRLHEVLEDCIAIGIPGFFMRKQRTQGQPPLVRRYPSEGVLPRDAFMREFGGDGLVAIKVTDKELFYEKAMEILGDYFYGGKAPGPHTEVTDGVEIQVWNLSGLNKIHTTYCRGYILLTQFKQTLLDAVERQKSGAFSLNSRSDFLRFEKHRGGKSAAAFAHISIQDLIELFKPFIPARELDELAVWGALDHASVQMGLGFHGGGICEWLHVAFSENPRGIFLNLARLWPTANLVEARTDRGQVYGASLTFDWAALYNVVMLTLDLCEVDTSYFRENFKLNYDLDLREDVFGALGNRMGGLVVIPHHGFIPETSLVLSIRNREKMDRLLSMLDNLYRHAGLKTEHFSVPGGGPRATYLDLGHNIPLKPAYVVNGDNLVISTMPLTLKYAMMKSHRTGKRIIDLLPEGIPTNPEPVFSFFADPAPAAMNLYADFLKIVDSGQAPIPVRATDLPPPEFIAQCLSKFGIEFAADPYYMSIDLHSPTGIVLPLAIGALLGRQVEGAERMNVRTTRLDSRKVPISETW